MSDYLFEERERLRTRAIANGPRLRDPDAFPIIPVSSRVTWAATTAVAVGNYVTADSRVYYVEKAGITASTKPTGFGHYITDGTAVYSYIGELQPVPYANNLAMVQGQEFIANGGRYIVSAAGTTAGAGSGPATPTGGTDGTVAYSYLGPQTLPVVTQSASALPGVSSQLAWTSPLITILGGTYRQDGAQPRGQIFSASGNGVTLDQGGGKFCIRTDAPRVSLHYFFQYQGAIYVDGEFVSLVFDTSGAASFLNLDFSGMPRRVRDIVFEAFYTTRFIAVHATASDNFQIYYPASPAKAVILCDSFGETGAPQGVAYADRLGRVLGIEDWRVSSIGGSGLRANGTGVNYVSRWNSDVAPFRPDYVFIQMTRNDTSGIPASWTEGDVIANLRTLIERAQLINAVPIVIGVWNNREPLTTGTAYNLNAAGSALCATLGVPFIDWSALLTDGGFAGSPSGTGNSLFCTGSDGTHPTAYGHRLRAEYLAPRVALALDGPLPGV